jgi:minor histocompatibility antigen H13
LRFDLFLHYLRQPGPVVFAKDNAAPNRPSYVEATGLWGERFWTWGSKSNVTTEADGARFKKVYFKASMVGYVIGLVTTLVVLNIFNHGQPALFYLVPAVLGSLWGTALFRGDISLMWAYTEDGSLEKSFIDEKDQKVVKKPAKELSDSSKGSESTAGSDRRILASSSTSLEEASKTSKKAEEHAQHVFLFSLTAPKSRPAALLFDKS